MKLITISDSKKWNDFILANSPDNFLQSWEWGKVQEKNSKQVFYLALVSEDGLIQAVVLLVESSLPAGFKYYYSPRGPIFSNILSGDSRKKISEFLDHEISIWADKKVLFWRLEPLSSVDLLSKAVKTAHCQPEQSLRLDLTLSEEDLLSAMHPKTRYNIRLAEKKGVEIVAGLGDSDQAAFVRLMGITTERDGFRGHSKSYYRLLASADPKFIKLFLAKYQGKIIAGALFSFWGDTATYMHGASSDEYRNVMAPYLLQWKLIQEAKSAGLKRYDFYGIDENKWPGVTRFKLGFGGERILYPGTFDYPIKPFIYRLYNLLRSWRRS